MRLKQRIYLILDIPKPGDRLSRWFDIFLIGLIFLNVLAMIAESVEGFDYLSGTFYHWFEIVSVLIFTVEYVLRIWTCTENPRYGQTVTGRIRFLFSPMVVIDLLAILPFYLPFVCYDLRSIRAIRLFRFFRVAKVARYSKALQTLGRVITSKKAELMTTLFVLILLLVIASTFMYFAENEKQPEVFSSIPAAMWWAVATLTTVGYGDVCPITPLGKFMASIIAILGIGMFALPTGILGAGFVEEVQNSKKALKKCPYCGGDLT